MGRCKKSKVRAGEADRGLYRKNVKNREVRWQEYTTHPTYNLFKSLVASNIGELQGIPAVWLY